MSKVAFGGTHRRSIALLGDLLRGREQRARSKAEGVSAAEIMTSRVETAQLHESVRAAARRMIVAGVKRLPVPDEDRLVGIASARLLNTSNASDQSQARSLPPRHRADPRGTLMASVATVRRLARR